MSFCAIIYCPTATGGQFKYSAMLAHHLCLVRPNDKFWLLTTPGHDDLGSLPSNILLETMGSAMRDRTSFQSKFSWILNRITYYIKRELEFLSYLARNRQSIVVHIQSISTLMKLPVALLARFIFARTLVFTLHNVVPHERLNSSIARIERILTSAFLRLCNVVIVHSEGLRQMAIERYGLDEGRVRVIEHPVWLSAASTKRPLSKRASNIPRVLVYGNLRRNKAVDRLLEAFLQNNGRWNLTIAGAVSDPEYFESRITLLLDAAKSKSRDIDLRIGFVEESAVADLFAEADVVALTYDGFGAQSGVLFDAMAMRVPVVVTNEGALAETVLKYGVGKVAESLEASDLNSAIEQVVTMSLDDFRRGVDRMFEELSWERAAKRTFRIYEEVVHSRGVAA